jgi:hypothetical protein
VLSKYTLDDLIANQGLRQLWWGASMNILEFYLVSRSSTKLRSCIQNPELLKISVALGMSKACLLMGSTWSDQASERWANIIAPMPCINTTARVHLYERFEANCAFQW